MTGVDHRDTPPSIPFEPFSGGAGAAGSCMLTAFRFAAFGAWLDIAALFRRSRLGTLWRSLGLMALIGLIGLLFGAIFKTNLRDVEVYVVSLALGVMIWDFMASSLNQSCAAFSTYAPSLRYSLQPLAAIPLRICLRNGVHLLQTTLLAALAHAAILGRLPPVSPALLPGLLCIAVAVYAVSVAALMACIRFRDLPQFVAWVSHLAFFLTPILWPDYFLGRYLYLRDINPFYHFVELYRAPLQGTLPAPASWACAAVLTVLLAVAVRLAYRRWADRVVYWL